MPDLKKKIAIAADHGGFHLKNLLVADLREQGYDVLDLGTHTDDKVDYPDYGYKLAGVIADGQADCGIALCGSGIGIDIALNRNPKVRSALCHDVTSARLARQHNDANVLTLGARIIGSDVVYDCVRMFLNTPFEGGRHVPRVEKLGKC